MLKKRSFILSLCSIILFGIFCTLVFTLFEGAFFKRKPMQSLPTETDLSRSDSQRLPASLSSSSPDFTSKRCQNMYMWVCDRKDETPDPTGTVRADLVGERQALQIYKQIIKDHKNWNLDQIDQELINQIYTPKRRIRVESAYRWAKRAVETFFDKQSVFTLQQKAQIKTLIHNVELQLPPPASTYADEPDLFTKDEAYYERTHDGKVRLRVGGAYLLIAKSWFNLLFTLAHEIAHSIDPCELKHYGLNFPAYDRLKSCFIRNGLIGHLKIRSECGPHDQLSETFADWIAVQVTSEYLKVFATEFQGEQVLNAARNSVRDLCHQDDETMEIDLEFHPSPEVRIEKIFGHHPDIRYQLGCEPIDNSQSNYCTFEPEVRYD